MPKPAKPAEKRKKQSDEKVEFDRWVARIATAKKALQPVVDDGEKSRDHYEGRITPQGYENTIAVNLVYVDLKQSVSDSYAKNPMIFVDPDEPGAEADAHAAELMVNKKWYDLKMKEVCREAIKATKLDGICAFKTYFNFSEDFVKDEWNDRVQNDEVRTDVVLLKDLLKDPAARSWTASPWIAHRVQQKREDIAERFGVDKEQITKTGADAGTEGYDTEVREDFEYGTFYEVEDRRKGMVFYIIEGIDHAVKPAAKKYPYDTMYDFLPYNDIPGRPNPKNDFSFWRDQLIELSTYRTMEAAHARKGNSKYIATCQTQLDPEQITQIKCSDDGVIVQLKPDQSLVAMQHAALDPQIFQAENACRGDIQLISKQAARQMPGQAKTATEVKAVEMAAGQQTDENLERLEECMASIANKWIALMQKNYTATRMVALSGMTDAEFLSEKNVLKDAIDGNSKHPFLKVTNKNISRKVKASIKAGSTAPDNEQTRMARLQGFAAFVATAQLQAGVDQEELLNEAAEVFGVENDNLLLRKDNPMEESRLLNNNVYIAPKIGEDHRYHLEIHERETNNSNANVIHILGHKMFENQKQRMAEAQAVTAPPPAAGAPTSGASFNGMAPLPPMPGMGQAGQAGPLPQPGPVAAPGGPAPTGPIVQ